MTGSLLVNEIFLSIQGESTFAGWPCTFVRLAGCDSTCNWCDTRYAADEEGRTMTITETAACVEAMETPLVEITGGEPLQQESVYTLMDRLCDTGYTVLVETGGFLPVQKVDPRVHIIIDIKTPSSGVSEKNCIENIERTVANSDRPRENVEFKMVIASRRDYEWAREMLDRWDLTSCCTVLMGTVFDALPPSDLAAWILEDHLHVKLQLQQHKYIWPPDMRGV